MNSQTKQEYSCVIIDDDQIAIDLISEYIHALEPLYLSKSYIDPLRAVHEILKDPNEIDFLFLDIEMDGISGIDVANLLRDKVRFLVFITSFGQFALKAFEVNCDQFLTKPLELAKFAFTVDNLLFRRYGTYNV